VGQEQPGGAAGRVPGGRIAGGLPVLVQPPGRGQRLVEGAPPGGGRVAVPSAVGPLPGDQGSGQGADPRVGGQAEPAAGGQGVSLDGGVGVGEPADARDAAPQAGQPGEDMTGSRDRARLARGGWPALPGRPARCPRQCAPVHLRYGWTPNPPSGAGRIAARSPWRRPAPGRRLHLPVHQGRRGGSSAGWPAHRSSAARYGGVRPRIHALPSQAALARLTMRRRRGSRVWRFRQAM